MNLIEIEIGTVEEKEKWKCEIDSILKNLGDYIKEFKISKVIVASNFDETVNRIQGTDNYQAKRHSVEAQAIVINDIDGNNYIVISGNFWKTFDSYEIKSLFLLHEIYHVFNKLYLPTILNEFTSKSTYLFIVHYLYDEYTAVRFSVSCLIQNPNIHDVIRILYDGSISELQNPEIFYIPMKKVIFDFTSDKMTNKFNSKIYEYIEPIFKYVANIFAYCKCYPDLKDNFDNITNKIFITEDLFDIFNKFDCWYKRDKSIIYEDCLDLIENYLKKLGISYSDVDEGILITAWYI